MLGKQREEDHDIERKISIRWKVLQVLGAILMALGFFIDWPPSQEANLLDTASFFLIIGALIMSAGLLIVLRRA